MSGLFLTSCADRQITVSANQHYYYEQDEPVYYIYHRHDGFERTYRFRYPQYHRHYYERQEIVTPFSN